MFEVIAALIVAVATIVAAVLTIWVRRGGTRSNERKEQGPGIKITRPAAGEVVSSGQIEVAGTFDVQPPDGAMFLLTAPPAGTSYWPQVGQPIEFSQSRKTWRGTAWVHADGRILVVTVGSGGRALFRYYESVGLARGEWQPIEELPPDVLEHDRVFIRLRSSHS